MALAAVATVLAQLDVWAFGVVAGPPAVMSALMLAATVPLAWRRRAPLAVLVVSMLAVSAQAVLTGDAAEGIGGFAPFLVPLYAVGAYASLRRAVIGALVATAAGVVHGIFDTTAVTAADQWSNAFFWLLSAAAWLAGVSVRYHRDAVRLAVRAERAERATKEQAIAAVAAERARIARELHDVVAHTLSVMIVQADAGELFVETDPGRARAALAAIGATGRRALKDMRRLLAILRAGDDGPVLVPQPGIDDLPALVDAVRSTGLDVVLQRDGLPRPLPDGVDLCVYRVVQEALTNVLKHAHAHHVQIRLRIGPHELEVCVHDDGTGAHAGPSGGHGLIGLQERVRLYEGRLTDGPHPDGGYRVAARLPLLEADT